MEVASFFFFFGKKEKIERTARLIFVETKISLLLKTSSLLEMNDYQKKIQKFATWQK
jgi:hypothetical protein